MERLQEREQSMTDSQYKLALDTCLRRKIKYKQALERIEKEYERRFGFTPSDLDDDYFLDTFHYQSEDYDFEDLIGSAESALNIKRDKILEAS